MENEFNTATPWLYYATDVYSPWLTKRKGRPEVPARSGRHRGGRRAQRIRLGHAAGGGLFCCDQLGHEIRWSWRGARGHLFHR